MAEEIIKVQKHVKQDEGYKVVYEETSTDMVKHADGTTASDHIDRKLQDTEGIHGVRYNEDNDMLEFYDETSEKWIPVMYVGTYIVTDNYEVITTRAGEELGLM